MDGVSAMTNEQLWLAIGIPTVTVLIGILLNQLGLSRTEMGQNRLENRLQVIEGDLRRFWQILGEHSARLDNIEKTIERK